MEITRDTRILEILLKYGDIADVIEISGIKRAGRDWLRMLLAKALRVEWTSKVHRVLLDIFSLFFSGPSQKKTGEQSMTGPSKRLEETRKAFRHGDEAAEFIDACIVSPCPQAGLNHFADLAESGGIQSTHRVDITHVS